MDYFTEHFDMQTIYGCNLRPNSPLFILEKPNSGKISVSEKYQWLI